MIAARRAAPLRSKIPNLTIFATNIPFSVVLRIRLRGHSTSRFGGRTNAPLGGAVAHAGAWRPSRFRQFRWAAGADGPDANVGTYWRERTMKRILIALAAATMVSSPVLAAKIGVSMDKFDDNFLTVLRNGMSDYAKTLPGVTSWKGM
jgi:hypothetical protein